MLSSGLVNVLYNGKNYRTNVANGNFSVQITNCVAGVSTAYINAYDGVANKVSDTLALSITAGNNAAAGKLTACKINNESSITFTVGTHNFAFNSPVDSFNVSRDEPIARTTIEVRGANKQDYLLFSFKGNAAAGDYPLETLSFVGNDSSYSKSGSPIVRITQYGASNEFIAGNFSGSLQKSDSTIHPMNFTFRVRRK
jgi:hypothetical protein